MRRTRFIIVQDRTQNHTFQSFLASSSSGVFIKRHRGWRIGWRIGWRSDIERAVLDDQLRSVVTQCPPLFATARSSRNHGGAVLGCTHRFACVPPKIASQPRWRTGDFHPHLRQALPRGLVSPTAIASHSASPYVGSRSPRVHFTTPLNDQSLTNSDPVCVRPPLLDAPSEETRVVWYGGPYPSSSNALARHG